MKKLWWSCSILFLLAAFAGFFAGRLSTSNSAPRITLVREPASISDMNEFLSESAIQIAYLYEKNEWLASGGVSYTQSGNVGHTWQYPGIFAFASVSLRSADRNRAIAIHFRRMNEHWLECFVDESK